MMPALTSSPVSALQLNVPTPGGAAAPQPFADLVGRAALDLPTPPVMPLVPVDGDEVPVDQPAAPTVAAAMPGPVTTVSPPPPLLALLEASTALRSGAPVRPDTVLVGAGVDPGPATGDGAEPKDGDVPSATPWITSPVVAMPSPPVMPIATSVTFVAEVPGSAPSARPAALPAAPMDAAGRPVMIDTPDAHPAAQDGARPAVADSQNRNSSTPPSPEPPRATPLPSAPFVRSPDRPRSVAVPAPDASLGSAPSVSAPAPTDPARPVEVETEGASAASAPRAIPAEPASQMRHAGNQAAAPVVDRAAAPPSTTDTVVPDVPAGTAEADGGGTAPPVQVATPISTPTTGAVLATSQPVEPAPRPEARPEVTLDIRADGRWIDRLAGEVAGLVETTGHARLRLNPETLGSLHVELLQGEDGLSVRFEVTSEAARAALQQAEVRLVADARVHGVRIADAQTVLVAEPAPAADANTGQAGAGQGGERRAAPLPPDRAASGAPRAAPDDPDTAADSGARYA